MSPCVSGDIQRHWNDGEFVRHYTSRLTRRG
jgi:hypothetical protein